MFSLLPEDAAVLLAGRFSGLTISHTAVLIAKKSNPYYRQPRVYVCVSDHTDAQRAELQQTVAAMGCKSRRKRRRCVQDDGVFSHRKHAQTM